MRIAVNSLARANDERKTRFGHRRRSRRGGPLADGETIALFFFDVLGFAERVAELGLPRILAQYESLLTMTVLIWTRYDPLRFRGSADIVLDFFCDCLRNGLPLRGGSAFGNAVMDEARGIFLGQPIIEAARAEAAQRWCGCSFGPSLDDFLALGPVDRFMPYGDQMKPGSEDRLRGLAFDWPRRWESLFPADDLDAVLHSYRRPGFESYWEVTQAFADHSRANRDWWRSLVPGN